MTTTKEQQGNEEVLTAIRKAVDTKDTCRNVVIYHAKCSDGFGAAWAVWKALGKSAEYFPATHGIFDPLQLKGDYCFIVDFSFDLTTLLEIQRSFKRVIVLDHHKSAEETLRQFGSAIFDNERSGAGIAWDSFHQDKDEDDLYSALNQRPQLINYIEDRDLWRKKLYGCDEIQCYTEMLEHDFAKWSHYAEVLEDDRGRDEVIEEGAAILRFKNFVVAARSRTPRIVRIGQHDVPVANCIPEFRSELGNALAKGHPYSVVWGQASDGKFLYSLRSTPDGEDVSVIAAQYGGGGHRNASGFSSDHLLW